MPEYEDDDVLHSSRNMLQRIDDDAFWKDLKRYLEGTVKTSIEEMKACQTMQEVAREQGVIAVCEDILGLPETWLNYMAVDEQDEERNA